MPVMADFLSRRLIDGYDYVRMAANANAYFSYVATIGLTGPCRRWAHCMITAQLETFALQILLHKFGKSQLLLQLVSILSLKK